MTDTLRADARRNRARIVAAAEELLASRGLSVPIDDIAVHAGVGIGTVYRHFPTKEALFAAIVVSRMERLVETARAGAASDDAGTALFDFFVTMIDSAAEHRGLIEGMADAGFDIHEAKASVKADLELAIEGLLTRAQSEGAVRPDVGIAELMALMTGACLGLNAPNVDASVRARGIDVLLDGLRA
jgi:AcrR family transcriptional regulator